MTPLIGGILFLLLFAIIMVAVSFGTRFVEAQGKKNVQTMINPETGDYQVTPLDAALRARFLHVPVRPDRAAWLAWAGSSHVHPAVMALARAHEPRDAEAHAHAALLRARSARDEALRRVFSMHQGARSIAEST